MRIEYIREMKRSYMTVKMEDWEIAESYDSNRGRSGGKSGGKL